MATPETKSSALSPANVDMNSHPNFRAADSSSSSNLVSADTSGSGMTSYNINISNTPSLINVVNNYISLHPEFFNTNISQTVVTEDDQLFPIYNEQLDFDDKMFGVYGYIETKYTAATEETKKNYQMILTVYKKAKDRSSYLDKMKIYVNKQARYGNHVNLTYFKVLSTKMIKHNFYNEDAEQWKKDIVEIENSFFSPHKGYLFDIMREKANEKQQFNNSWNNLILHGPPGTGKSSLIYRFAVLMKKSIISIDLSQYVDKKKELYSIFHNQDFMLPGADPEKDDKQHVDSNCIIICEEFDACIEKLENMEKIHKFKEGVLKGEFSSAKLKALMSSLTVSKGDRKSKHNMMVVNNEIKVALNNISADSKSDDLRMNDLLELFQGPVPVDGRMIIATTNHFDRIKNILPALFRPGRCTPVRLGYLDWNSFKELVKYIFNSDVEGEFPIILPTSQLKELAIKNRVEGDVKTFIAEIKSLTALKLEEEKKRNSVEEKERKESDSKFAELEQLAADVGSDLDEESDDPEDDFVNGLLND
jgi:hypothetical protein